MGEALRRLSPLLRLAPPLTLALFLGPVAGGLLGTLLPAFGWLPALGASEPSLEPWRRLLALPGLGHAVALTLASGVGGTLLAFAGAVLIAAACHGRRAAGAVRVLLPPLLAVPHLASAVALAFLVAPSGWLARLASPWLTGWARPPDLLTVNDPAGIALTLGLGLRECPFILLVLLAAQSHLPAAAMVAVARTQDYGRGEAWLKVVLPALYRQVRLPLMAVLAFSLAVVDMAQVLGPSAPPVLAVQLLRLFNDPDLSLRPVAAAGAVLQLGLVLLALAAWRAGEAVVGWCSRPWLSRGPSRGFDRLATAGGALAGAAVATAGLLGLVALGLWSVAAAWRFPAALPEGLSLASWSWAAGGLAGPAARSLLLGLLATLVALVLALACLEHEVRGGTRRAATALTLLYLPLLLPQVSFLFGLQVLFARIGLDGTFAGVLWSHLAFVLPYVLLTLQEPYLALDPRWPAAGAVLGSGPGRVLRRVRLPLLRRPLAVAAAVGFTVSVAQYLPTLSVGGGRQPTLTTEALALALGGDRRLAAAAALLLTLLPLTALAAATAVPPALPRARPR